MKVLLIWTITILILLDSHIQHFLPIERNFSVEIIFLVLSSLFVIKEMMKEKISLTLFLILLLFFSNLIIGTISNGPYVTVIGLVFLFKFLLAFLAGRYLSSDYLELRSLFKFIYFLAIISAFLSIIQFSLDIPIIDNPFHFNTKGVHRFVLGLFENRNKNAQLIILGYVFSNILYPKNSFLFHFSRYGFFLIIIFIVGSRQGLIAMILIEIIILYTLKTKNTFSVYFVIISAVMILFVSTNLDLLSQKFHEIDNILKGQYFRVQAAIISTEVIKDYPLFGLGPGTFGGAVANKFSSHYHEQYRLFSYWDTYTKNIPKTIDTYWPHLMAEVGIVGLLLTGTILSRIIMLSFNLKARDKIELLSTAAISAIFFSFFSMNLETIHTAQITFFLVGILISNQKNINVEN